MDLREHLTSLSTSPQKILKIVIAISVVLLVMWLLMISRMDYGGENTARGPVTEQRVDSLDTALTRQNEAPVSTDGESSGIFANALVTFLILLVILGIVWFWTSGKSQFGGSSQKNREIGSQRLGEGAQMKIIEINDEVWVLGVTAGSVDLLHRYPKSEWNEPRPESSTTENNFSKIFKSKT
ncbi:flagellar biosynthetic protein FliO [Aliifodinibius sp. S!AR15-10]|uniref:flagellar biosynthetic protein FliO n=1 Tax=Aliifodinibius sp. S!AR15-10 TaxID=2950437 RepID=UPI0028649E8A|nr:flagellar biosynthetic protein FliO [Aliifodinibius sp. S!AR15-10]MDR8394243.1 flagellar biosynthetic protein FliO [Aliifodinibius sp. S!AR15-10]